MSGAMPTRDASCGTAVSRACSAIAHLDRERIDAPPQFVPYPLVECLVCQVPTLRSRNVAVDGDDAGGIGDGGNRPGRGQIEEGFGVGAREEADGVRAH